MGGIDLFIKINELIFVKNIHYFEVIDTINNKIML